MGVGGITLSALLHSREGVSDKLDAERAQPEFADALQAWFNGDFERCLRLTESSCGDVQCVLLRARALLRLGRPRQVLDELQTLPPLDHNSDAGLTCRMLSGAARIRLDEIDRGLGELRDAERDAGSAHETIRSEIALSIALGHLGRRDLAAAQRALETVEPSTDIVHARAYEYRGWIASARAEYERATAMFATALRRLEACAHYDRFLEVNCLQALAHLAVERFDRGTWSIVTEHRARLDWSAQGLAHPRFVVALRGAVYAYDVEGDPVRAAAEARFAESIAPSAAYRVQALCMRASVARHAGESVAQRDHLHAALELLSQSVPESLEGDERLVPLAVAEELANVGRSAEARELMRLYDAHGATSPMLAITNDLRRDGYEKLVLAQVLDAEQNVPQAIAAYREAFETFRRVGYVRRSVMAALRIAKIAPEEEYLWGHIDVATAGLADTSWIRTTASALRRRAIGARLTAVQREYLRLLCAGKSNPEIARIRNRSVHTVRNQIVPLFEIFGVQSRSELVAECVRSGVLDHEPPTGTTGSAR